MQKITKDVLNFPLITSYGQNFIKFNNNKITNNILLFSDGNQKSMHNFINNIGDLNIDILKNLFDSYYLKKDILLIGCGKKYSVPDPDIRYFIHKNGFSLEWLTTKSAINTWNLLLEDFRDVMFLLIWD